MANKTKQKEMISTRTFIKQLRAELELELRDELGRNNTREVRSALRDAVYDRVNGGLLERINVDIDKIKEDVRESVQPVIEAEREKRTARRGRRIYKRLNLSLRLQHGLMAISVIWLIITGLPLKFPDVPVFVGIMSLLGGIDNSTWVHRLAATGLIVVSLWHVVYIIFFRDGRRDFLLMLPRWKDITDFMQQMRFYFGKSSEKPKFGRFSYVEKFDYWAVYWGCVIMIGTGAVLWSPEITFSIVPKFIYDIAKEVHSDEALLATLAIIIWHFYNVHFNPSRFPGSMVWFHGRMTEEEMEEEHPLELEEIKRAQAEAQKKEQEAAQ